jgi:integrase
VRVYERTRGGVLHISAWDPTLREGRGGYRRQSLGHRKRDKAKAYAREVSERLQAEMAGLDSGPVRLADLFALFRRDRLPEVHGKHRREMERQLELWQRFLGDSFDVRTFSRREWDLFHRQRSKGMIDSRGHEVPRADKRRSVGERVCGKDMAFIRSVFKWATEWRDPRTHRFLLEGNPARGLPLPKEADPRQPVMTEDRYRSLVEVADRVSVRVGYGKKAKWVRSPLREILILAEGTGRRIGAVVQLLWSDWLPDRGSNGAIRWRADSDKIGREWIAPVTPEVREALERWQRESLGVGDVPIFPQPNEPTRCLCPILAAKWLRKAESLANLEHLKGGLWHPFRRKWAMERKGFELRDVAYAGGWKEPTTLLRIYQQPDPETLERVVVQRRKLREA